MANPYLASLLAVWRREKQKRAVATQPQPKKQSSDIWGAPLRAWLETPRDTLNPESVSEANP